MRLDAAISDCGDADLGDTELKLEQKYAINFMVRDNVKPGDIVKKISVVYGDKAVSRSQLYNLISQASHDVSTATRKAGSGRPSSAVTDENKVAVDNGPNSLLANSNITCDTSLQDPPILTDERFDSNVILICHC